ncbi:MAG: hypothetical protein A07HN63_01109 [uncultured archaeon A07HN63]|nr:MAG: hypothetical protein A07HN63_01109 [uncultured archaeon A07HN63]
MLADLRAHIESLASGTGEFTLVCGRYGEQPVPAAGLRFPTRAVARSAAAATAQYRERLRAYDPSVPQYDIVICQGHPTVSPASAGSCAAPDPTLPAAAVDSARVAEPLVAFCHRVAAAVFGALADRGHDGIETAVMEAYGAHAATDPSADDLCLRLLERMSAMVSTRLPPDEQAALLDTAADRLDSVAATQGCPPGDIDAVLDSLDAEHDIAEFRDTAWEQCRRTGTRTLRVDVSAYAFAPLEGRLPTLPIVIALYESALDWRPVAVSVRTAGDGWQFRIAPVGEAAPAGLASAPIGPARGDCP